jgi:thymidylate synthase
VYRQIVHQPDVPVDPDSLAVLHPGHRWLVAHRWPDRMLHKLSVNGIAR